MTLQLTFAGYFPKKIEPAIEAMNLPGVSEIWSASDCISEGPPDWVLQWKHNRVGLYDTLELARSVIPEDQIDSFRILAFRIGSLSFAEGGESPFDLSDLTAVPPPVAWHVVGYDAVSSTQGNQFECSPLSCNGAGREFRTNAKCLFDTLEEAIRAARTFASGAWEPGPYWVVEILAPDLL